MVANLLLHIFGRRINFRLLQLINLGNREGQQNSRIQPANNAEPGSQLACDIQDKCHLQQASTLLRDMVLQNRLLWQCHGLCMT